MGVHTLQTQGSDVTVAMPAEGNVLVGNCAGAWQALPLDNPTAFPVIADLRQRVEVLEAAALDFEARITALEAP